MGTTQSKRSTFPARLHHMDEQLRERIAAGRYAPESLLPSELALGKQYGLSNKSVRKVLEQLKADGLIEKIPRVGSVVKGTGRADAVTLRLGTFSSLERDIKLSGLLADFRNEHPSVDVEMIPVPRDIGALRQYLLNGFFDAITLYDEFFHSFVELGIAGELLEPLTRQENMYAYANETFSHEGVQYAQPIVFSPVVLAYNTDHFHEAGLLEPDGGWTWDDCIRQAARLAIPGERFGLYFYPLSDNRWPVFLLQSGMSFKPDADGRCRLDGTKMMECLRLCKAIIRNRDIFPTDHYLESDGDVSELFRLGKVSMMMTTYMSLNTFGAGNVNYDISPVPYSFEPRTLVNVVGVAVNRFSAHPSAARSLADYLASPRAQRFIRDNTVSIPSLKPVAESPSAGGKTPGGFSRYPMFRDIMAGYRRHRDLGLTTSAFVELRRLLKRYWSDLIDDDALCREIDALVAGENG